MWGWSASGARRPGRRSTPLSLLAAPAPAALGRTNHPPPDVQDAQPPMLTVSGGLFFETRGHFNVSRPLRSLCECTKIP